MKGKIELFEEFYEVLSVAEDGMDPGGVIREACRRTGLCRADLDELVYLMVGTDAWTLACSAATGSGGDRKK